MRLQNSQTKIYDVLPVSQSGPQLMYLLWYGRFCPQDATMQHVAGPSNGYPRSIFIVTHQINLVIFQIINLAIIIILQTANNPRRIG